MQIDAKSFIEYHIEVRNTNRGDLALLSENLFEQVTRAHDSVRLLSNPKNWNIPRLLTEDGRLRKPRLWLQYEINKLGHLTIYWEPLDVTNRPKGQSAIHAAKESDFTNWEPQPIVRSKGGKYKYNKAFCILNFKNIFGVPLEYNSGTSDAAKIKRAIAEAGSHVFSVHNDFIAKLNVYFEVESNLLVDYDISTGIFTGRPEDIKRIGMIATEKERKAWRKREFTDFLGVTPESAAWANLHYMGELKLVTKYLSEISTTMDRIPAITLRRLLDELIRNHLDFYHQQRLKHDYGQANTKLLKKNNSTRIQKSTLAASTRLRSRSTLSDIWRKYEQWKDKHFDHELGVPYAEAMAIFKENGQDISKAGQILAKTSKFTEKTTIKKFANLLLVDKKFNQQLEDLNR
jgi:hypothetical protein